MPLIDDQEIDPFVSVFAISTNPEATAIDPELDPHGAWVVYI